MILRYEIKAIIWFCDAQNVFLEKESGEADKKREKRKWTIGNKTQTKRHYVYYEFVRKNKYAHTYTQTNVTNRAERPNFTTGFWTECSVVQTFHLLMMVMTTPFDMCHFYIDKMSHSLFSNDVWMLTTVAIPFEFG